MGGIRGKERFFRNKRDGQKRVQCLKHTSSAFVKTSGAEMFRPKNTPSEH